MGRESCNTFRSEQEIRLATSQIFYYQREIARKIGSDWGIGWGFLGEVVLNNDLGRGLLVRVVGIDPRRANDCGYYLIYDDGHDIQSSVCGFRSNDRHVRCMDYYNSTGWIVLGDRLEIPVRMGNLDVEGWNGEIDERFKPFPQNDIEQAGRLADFFSPWLDRN